MKVPDKITAILRGPPFTRKRMFLALAVAVVADGLQILLLPFAWTFVESAVDVVTMVFMILILGFHPLLLPTFLIELIPLVDELPTWTACVAAVIAWRRLAKLLPPAG
jgi:hypothetical protein